MTELNYLTVDCFLYDLVEGFGESEGKIQENCRRFWHRIYDNSLTDKQFAELQARGETLSNYIELLGKQRIEALKYPLDGYYYPVKLGDTYALQIDCSGKLNDADWQQLPQPHQASPTVNPTATFIFAFSISLIIGLVFAGLTGLILSVVSHFRSKYTANG